MLTRRTLLKRAVAATPAVAYAGALAAPAAQARRATLPTARQLAREVGEMVALGPRLTATSPHLQFIDGLEDGFRAAGCSIARDPQPFTQWLASRWALDVAGRAVPVASYYTYSGMTPPQGVSGDLVYAGPLPASSTDVAELMTHVGRLQAALPGGLAGRIVLMDAPIAPLVTGALDPLLTYRYDPGRTIRETDDYKRAWTTLATLPRPEPFKAAGAAGGRLPPPPPPAQTAAAYNPVLLGV